MHFFLIILAQKYIFNNKGTDWWKHISREWNCPTGLLLVKMGFSPKAPCQQTDLTQKSDGVYLELMDRHEKDMSA